MASNRPEFLKQTTLVLGAGASAPYHYPLGDRLLNQCANEMSAFSDRQEWLGYLGTLQTERVRIDPALCKKFHERLRKATPPSIDLFLKQNPEFSDCGKVAIARSLLPFEADDHLFAESGQTDDWYKWLFRTVVPLSRSPAEFASLCPRVVTFNYDRSLERSLIVRLSHYFGCGLNDALSAVRQMEIVHVYGSLGPLDGLARPKGHEGHVGPDAVALAVRSLTTIGEHDSDSSNVKRARELVAASQTAVILGCAYHRENIDLIGLNEFASRARHAKAGVVLSCFQLGGAMRSAIAQFFGASGTGDPSTGNPCRIAGPDERCSAVLENHFFLPY